MAAKRIRAYHPESGSILVAEVTRTASDANGRSFEVIPDGLLEAVIIREGTWHVTELPDA